jgi:hypothetical protein
VKEKKLVMAHPSKEDLAKALGDAGSAHHEYEQVTLGGKRDEQWSAFYAAYTLGRIGDFATPSALSQLLEEAPAGKNWAVSAANYVLSRLGKQ